MAETKEQESGQEQETEQEHDGGEQQEQGSGEEQSAAQQQEQESDMANVADDEDNSKAHLIAHLKDVHALEIQSIRQLERAAQILEDEDIGEGYKQHLDQTHEHEQKIKDRIEAYDLKPSAVKDLTMRAGAIGLRQLADVHPDTPVKLAMHFYAFEHLEIATYELLARIAKAADDDETAEAAEQILEQEREAAEMVAETFDRAAEMTLEREPQTDPEDLPQGQGKDSDEGSEDSDEEGGSSEDEGEEDSDKEGRASEDEGEDEEESSEEEGSTQRHPLAGDKKPAG
jgi:ferritin-like metal-binding protein YciE